MSFSKSVFRLLSYESKSVGCKIRALSTSSRFCKQLKYLNDDQLKQYNDDGYVTLHNVFAMEEVMNGRKAMDEVLKRASSLTKSDQIFEMQPGHTLEQPKVDRIRYPSKQHSVFDSFLRDARLLDAIEDLIGPSFRYIPQDKLNIKPAGHGAAIKWHQDWAFFPHTNDSVLTASILLYDSTRENGCLQAIPKSHKGPVISHYHDGKFVSTITDPNFDRKNVAYLEGTAGSVTIHNARIIHGSARNVSKTHRSTICYVFNSMDAWPLLGVCGDDFGNVGPVDFDLFNETLLRGEICVHPRLQEVPVSFPVPINAASTVLGMEVGIEEPEP